LVEKAITPIDWSRTKRNRTWRKHWFEKAITPI